MPVNILALPTPPPERLAALGVARISYGELIHAGVTKRSPSVCARSRRVEP